MNGKAHRPIPEDAQDLERKVSFSQGDFNTLTADLLARPHSGTLRPRARLKLGLIAGESVAWGRVLGRLVRRAVICSWPTALSRQLTKRQKNPPPRGRHFVR